MASDSVGNAYLNVVPRVDSGAARSAGASAGDAISGGLASSVSAGAVALGNIISDVVTKAGSRAGEELSKTFTNYMDFEQLAGGAQKIFDEIDYSKIQADAQAAYDQLNMSANEYLESINMVGATFAQTMGDQKGYDTARKGMQAISDYASGTGKSVEELNQKYQMISRSAGSYQSIADQFAGILPQTSGDFLEAAQSAGYLSDKYEKLTDVPVAEYQQAVTEMLADGVDALNLTNNTAHESADTLSGSFATVRAAWDNMLTAIGDGGETFDMSATAANLVESLGNAIRNSAERVSVIGQTLGQMVVDAIPDDIVGAFSLEFDPSGFERAVATAKGALGELSGVLGRLSEGFGAGFGETMGTLATSVGTFLSTLTSSVDLTVFEDAMIHAKGALSDLSGFISENAGPIATTLGVAFGGIVTAAGTLADVIATVVDVFGPLIPAIAAAMGAVKLVGVITTIVGAVSGFITTFGAALSMISGLPAVIGMVVTLMGGPVTVIAAVVAAIVGFLATNEDARNKVVEVWTAIKAKVTELVGAIATVVPQKWNELKSKVTSAMGALRSGVASVWNAIRSTVTNVAGSVVSGAVSRFNSLRSRVSSIFNAVKTAITSPINTAKTIVSNAISTISSVVRGVNLSLPHFPLPHFSVSGGSAPWGIGGKGSPPSFSVDWYGTGGYIDQPTLLAGVGERGGEFVWPSYAPYLDRYADALASRMGGGGVTVNLTYNGGGDATELARTLTRELRMLKMTGAI